MKKIILMSICVLCLSQLVLAASNDRIIAPVYLRNKIVDSIYIPDIIEDDDYEDYTVVASERMTMRYDKKKSLIYITPSVEETALTVLTLKKGNITYDIPVIITRTFRHIFSVLPKSINVSRAFVAGTFNNWSPTSLPMIPDEKGIPFIPMYLEPGRYFFKYVVDGEIMTDANLPTVADGRGGEMNLLNISPLKSNVSIHPLKVRKSEDGNLVFPFFVEGISSLQLKDIVAFNNNSLISGDYIRVANNHFFLTFPNNNNKEQVIRLGIDNGTSASRLYTFTANITNDIVNYTNVNDMTVYSILIDRFSDGSTSNNQKKPQDSVIPFAQYKGGDFAGITAKIKEGYFSTLNVNTLLLSPVADNPDQALSASFTAPSKSSAFFGLWPVHHEKIENHFGTFEELQTLVKEAHSSNMQVILDYVADQVHKDHPYVSEHPQWFLPLHGSEMFVKVFDYESFPDAIETVTDNIVWWIKRTNADGVKIDNAGTINAQFRRILATKIHDLEKRINKKITIMGHIRNISYLTPTLVSKGQINTFLNSHLYESFYTTAITTISFNTLTDPLSSDRLCDDCVNYIDEPIQYLHPKIPDKRTFDFISLPTNYQQDSINTLKTKIGTLPLYHLLTHTLPGLPLIQTGEELGYSATVTTTHPGTLYFDEQLLPLEQKNLLILKNITLLRKNNSALRNGALKVLYTSSDYVAYIRHNHIQTLLVAINNNSSESEMLFQIPPEFKATTLIDITSQERKEATTQIPNNLIVKFTVPAKSFKIFSIE